MEFLNRYAGGRPAKAHRISFEGNLYDMKAIWAAAHKPRSETWKFNTKDARKDLKELGFECIVRSKIPAGDGTAQFEEGKRRLRELALFSRHPGLVAQAKARYGPRCCGCKFDFATFYGPLGANYIECHHLNPLADQEGSTVSGVEDVTVLCSNCHRMVHRQHPPITLQELRKRIRAAAAISSKRAL